MEEEEASEPLELLLSGRMFISARAAYGGRARGLCRCPRPRPTVARTDSLTENRAGVVAVVETMDQGQDQISS
ncbi:hypothetical protein EVAR_65760_1 [Eumeta japonica]|uniref:Uncharacterized protein n=1 Tax=Eumeta variegata TaxID=151549 RepID=A0A4C1ZLW0_EUMVA|nr:hypothetical protein EVAR_65760_1 [Eumeta japonica]